MGMAIRTQELLMAPPVLPACKATLRMEPHRPWATSSIPKGRCHTLTINTISLCHTRISSTAWSILPAQLPTPPAMPTVLRGLGRAYPKHRKISLPRPAELHAFLSVREWPHGPDHLPRAHYAPRATFQNRASKRAPDLAYHTTRP